MNRYLRGNIVRVSGSYRDQDGAATDPGQALFQYWDGAGDQRTATPSRDGVGAFHVDLEVDLTTSALQETWTYRWYTPASDPLYSAVEGQFQVYTLSRYR